MTGLGAEAATVQIPATGGAARRAAGLPRLLPPVPGTSAVPARGDAPPEPPEGLPAHLTRNGRPRYRGVALIQAVKAAGLTGRGGAAFPAHVKLAAVAAQGGRKVVVANGAESEPASEKDAALLWHAPHLVLDGLQLAAEAVGASQAYLYLHQGRSSRLEEALAERASQHPDRVGVMIVEAPPRFLAGQETAMTSRISGGPALPTFGVPRVAERGVAGAPTLVQNVETLAHLALIARHGPRWFREAGTAAEPGTMLATIHEGHRPHVMELAIGTPLAEVLPRTTAADAGAILVGGYHGTWLPASLLAGASSASAASSASGELALANAALSQHQAALGAGVIAVLPKDVCGLREAARVTRYLAAESAGQCGPCLNGLPRIAGAMAELAGPRPRRQTRENVARWSGLVTGRGACHHPDGTVRFVRTALTVFADELRRHANGQCSATSREPFLPLPYGMPTSEEDWT
ncbi:MAG: NADH-quinone oxidoreductase subunit I [Streptosporangiaceae bacterium]|nr:NADH-quinone oxidoreductase subunit I [Streptosporangiaceae bacterium]